VCGIFAKGGGFGVVDGGFFVMGYSVGGGKDCGFDKVETHVVVVDAEGECVRGVYKMMM